MTADTDPSSTTPPEVSVLIPVRNGGRYLAFALDSILAQTGVAFEVICVDDGSTDGTAETLAAFAQRHPEVLRAVPASGTGISAALNQAIGLARGRFLARMDADDIAEPNRLAVQARYLAAHPELGALGSQALIIDAAGRERGRRRVPVGTERVHAALAAGSPLIHPSVMLRRDAVLRCGGYRSLFDGAEDYDLWLRLAVQTRLDNLPEALLRHRSHEGQQTRVRGFQQAHLAALAVVSAGLRETRGRDPFIGMATIAGWQAALAAVDPSMVCRVRCLTASRLVDNGGTLRAAGALYLQGACRLASRDDRGDIRDRLALACVRHELQLMRNGRKAEALAVLVRHIALWRGKLLRAYVRHASILWRARQSLFRYAGATRAL